MPDRGSADPHSCRRSRAIPSSRAASSLWPFAATRAGAVDADGREALLKYVLRPPLAQERVVRSPAATASLTSFAPGT